MFSRLFGKKREKFEYDDRIDELPVCKESYEFLRNNPLINEFKERKSIDKVYQIEGRPSEFCYRKPIKNNMKQKVERFSYSGFGIQDLDTLDPQYIYQSKIKDINKAKAYPRPQTISRINNENYPRTPNQAYLDVYGRSCERAGIPRDECRAIRQEYLEYRKDNPWITLKEFYNRPIPQPKDYSENIYTPYPKNMRSISTSMSLSGLMKQGPPSRHGYITENHDPYNLAYRHNKRNTHGGKKTRRKQKTRKQLQKQHKAKR